MDWRFGSSCRVPVSQAQSPEFKLESYQKREWNGGASEVNEGVKIIKEHFRDWRSGSSSRTPTLQAQSPDSNPSTGKKKERKKEK
jgi:hypothetical protein